MGGRRSLVVIGLTLGLGVALTGQGLMALAETRLAPGATVETDEKTRDEILATFHRAEQAIQARDLDALMAFYSSDYNYHGLKKPDVKKIWEGLFSDYSRIGTTHVFSSVRTTRSADILMAEVTCAGMLWATSDLTGLRVPLDSWYEEIHHLRREDGAWRIRGHIGETPRVLPFGTSPHPLF
ncbi:MAG: YybH family protein [Nitrospiraceae bacterium]